MSHARQAQDLQSGADLLLVGHGVRGACASASTRANAELATRLGTTGRFKQIRWGYLTCEPAVESIAADLRSATVYIVPMLMSDGYFSKSAIPEKLDLDGRVSVRENGQRIVQCMPLGLNAMMSAVTTALGLEHCRDKGLRPAETSVIVVGHGSSKSDASRRAVEAQVRQISQMQEFKDVHMALLEEAPDLPSVLRGVSGAALVVGYFANRGKHATTDVRDLIQHAGSSAAYLGPVGALPAISEVVMDCVSQDMAFGERT